MKKGRVLMIAPSYSEVAGGVENLMQKVVEKSQHEFSVVTEDRSDAVHVAQLPIKRLRGMIRVSRYLFRHRESIDLVYVSTARYLHLLIVPLLCGMGAICHAHGRDLFLETTSTKTALRSLLAAIVRRCGARFIAVSEWTRDQLVQQGVPASHTHLVPNGVDVSRFRRDASANARSVEETPAEVPLANAPPANAEKHVRRKWEIAPDSFLLLTVARLDPRKGHRLVIDALQHLPDCTYLIAGTGTEKAQLQRRARQCGVSERVVFAGLVPDTALPRVYQACDLFVMPSEHVESTHNVEGFGISFLEANAAGKAVVGTRTGGIPTAIRHEQTGLLCEPSVASVREAIRRMKDHPAFRRQCEQRAAEWAEAHQWSRIVPQIDAVIETALHEQERS